MEKDGSRADWLEGQLGSIVMRGDGDEMAFLQSTGIERADAVLAVFSESSTEIAKANVDVSKTYTNKYVDQARKTTGLNAK